jgi:Ca-activated chloride channel family protein
MILAAIDLSSLLNTFERPWVLTGLLVPALLMVRLWKLRGREVALPVDFGSRPSRTLSGRLITAAESLTPALLAIAIIIAANPQTTGSPITQRKLTNIMFCVDCSGSMTAPFGEGDRYDASMKAINQFLHFREGDAFGLTFFAQDVVRWCPLTRDVSAFECSLPFMRPDAQRAIGGGTMIARALTACRGFLEEQEQGDRMVILVSDGQSFDLMNGADEETARDLRDARIVLFGIHIGDTEIPAEISNMAQITGGEAFVSGDPAALETVFRRIDSMKPAEIEQIGIEYIDALAPFCTAGLSLALLIVGTAFGLRYTPW